VLSHLQIIVEQEAGQLYMAADGNITFRPRTWYEGGITPAETWGPGVGERRYDDLQISYDDAYLWNDARVTRQGGVTQRSTDSTSISDYGQLTLTRSTLHVDDNEALNTAEWLIDLYADTEPRIDRMVVHPQKENTAVWAEVLLADINRAWTVKFDPPGAGTTYDVDVVVQGVDHTIVPGFWEMVFYLRTLGAAETLTYWLVGSEQLDTGTRLA